MSAVRLLASFSLLFARRLGVFCLPLVLAVSLHAQSISTQLASGRSISGAVDLNQFGTSEIVSLACVMTGGGSYPGGLGPFKLYINLGGHPASYSVSDTGDGGGSVTVNFMNIQRNGSGQWTVSRVELNRNGIVSTAAAAPRETVKISLRDVINAAAQSADRKVRC